MSHVSPEPDNLIDPKAIAFLCDVDKKVRRNHFTLQCVNYNWRKVWNEFMKRLDHSQYIYSYQLVIRRSTIILKTWPSSSLSWNAVFSVVLHPRTWYSCQIRIGQVWIVVCQAVPNLHLRIVASTCNLVDSLLQLHARRYVSATVVKDITPTWSLWMNRIPCWNGPTSEPGDDIFKWRTTLL